jgi:DNA helicase HerA-like ATPase
MSSSLVDAIARGYSFSGGSLLLGAPLLDGAPAGRTMVRVPLSMMTRHGLVAGATGTGKTRTLQILAEQLSANGVPVFLADLKGDLSGLAAPGTSNPKIEERAAAVGVPFAPAAFPCEFLSLSGAKGIPLRATVSSFGPLLLARAFDLNETQRSVLAMVFQLCDDKGYLLLDLADLRAVLQHLTGPGADLLADYGGVSKATVGVLLRKMVEMEQQGAEQFFGEPEFEIEDLMRTDASGRGIVSLLELEDVQDRPAVFSTFLMWLLASLHRELPEAGDLAKPKLVFFFDEAHFLFEGASKAFLDQIEQVVRMIRSKGVGVFFVTQTPKDVPADVLAQLGNRIQHALRAFTPDDEKALKATANTFPRSAYYDIPQTLLSLGIGEALVTVLSEQGTPTPVAATRMAPPASAMGPIPEEERADRVRRSPLHGEYAAPVDRESARELLVAKANAATEGSEAEAAPAARGRGARSAPEAPSMGEKVGKAVNSPLGRAVGRELVRGLFGVLGISTAPRRRRRRIF